MNINKKEIVEIPDNIDFELKDICGAEAIFTKDKVYV